MHDIIYSTTDQFKKGVGGGSNYNTSAPHGTNFLEFGE